MIDVGSLGPREQTDRLFHSVYRGWGERSDLRKTLRLMNNLGRKANTVVYTKMRRSGWLRVKGNWKARKQSISGVTEFVMEVYACNIILKPTTKLFAPSSLSIQI